MRGSLRGPVRSLRVLALVATVSFAAAATACDRADAADNKSNVAVSRAPGDTLTDSALVSRADLGRMLGPDSAMWLVVISDFQCPYCKQWHDSSMAGVTRDFVDKGLVRLAFLNLPLPQHPHARAQAEAALCAGVQGKYWPYAEALFHDQARLAQQSDIKDYLDSLARASSVEMTEFARCRGTKAIRTLVDSDIQQANRAGVRSTPSFLIGQFLVEGAVPYGDFRKAIDTALFTARTTGSR